MAASPPPAGTRAEKMNQQRRRFSLQTPVNFISKMGRKLSIGSQHSGHSSRSSSCTESLSNLSDHYVTDRPSRLASVSNNERIGRSRSRKPLAVSAHGSEEELNRRFADFDTYFGGFDDAPAQQRRTPVPIILLQSADDEKEEDTPSGRQRSRSETRPPSHLSRLLKFNRRRPSQTENSPSPTSVTQSMEFPMPYERRGSFQSLSTLGVATPVLKCSLEQLPEGVQVHHATRTCSPSPEPSNGPFLSVPMNYYGEEPDKHGFKSAFRDRSATFSSTEGLDRSHPSAELSRPVQRERSVSFSVTQAGSPSVSHTPADDRTKKRRSLGYLFWPPSNLFGRSR